MRQYLCRPAGKTNITWTPKFSFFASMTEEKDCFILHSSEEKWRGWNLFHMESFFNKNGMTDVP